MDFCFQIFDAFKTGVCRKQHKRLEIAIRKAWDQGLLTYPVPFRTYDYSLYYDFENKKSKTDF